MIILFHINPGTASKASGLFPPFLCAPGTKTLGDADWFRCTLELKAMIKENFVLKVYQMCIFCENDGAVALSI